MNNIIKSSLITLQKSKTLLNLLSNDTLCDKSVSPYYSSIGSHIRHIYDFYDCALNIDETNSVDLTNRKRINAIETCCDSAESYFDALMTKIKLLDKESTDKITVTDDLGAGKIAIEYTFGALIAQANSHTIHHYAIISYILDRLGVTVEDPDFGYNPSTPKPILN